MFRFIHIRSLRLVQCAAISKLPQYAAKKEKPPQYFIFFWSNNYGTLYLLKYMQISARTYKVQGHLLASDIKLCMYLCKTLGTEPFTQQSTSMKACMTPRQYLHVNWTSLILWHALFTLSLKIMDVMTGMICMRAEAASWRSMPCSHLPSGCHDRQVLHESWTSLMTWHALFTPSLRMSWQTSSAWEHKRNCSVSNDGFYLGITWVHWMS